MKREIKFRVWDTENQEFFYPDELRIQYNQIGWTADHYLDIDSYGTKPEEYVLQQFTGLFDKNGKEIYEGDIIICRVEDSQTGVLKKGYAGIIHWNHSYFAVGEYKLFIMDDKALKVIGNVFENEELLENEI